ncbi:MAG: acyl-CoA dehydrogenase family protein [Rhodocyclaceae bacterium]|nr:acyl-CoA dehydrogenase family protein [Rhodocyclaceae bacterium]
MNLNLTEDQQALQDTLRKFAAKEFSFAKRRALAKEGAGEAISAAGFSPAAWQQLAEIGVLALPFEEAYGGLGGSALDTMVVMEELGRGLMIEPYLGTVILSGGLIASLGSDSQKETLLASIGSGESLVALAHQEPGKAFDAEVLSTSLNGPGDGLMLNGNKAQVLYGAQSHQVLVSVNEANGISLFLIDSKAQGVTWHDQKMPDGTRVARLELNQVSVSEAARVGGKGAAGPALSRAFDVANAALCAEAVGIIVTLIEITSEYLKTRKQFGVTLGTFQALKHRMVDMFVWSETARSATMLATVRVATGTAAEAHWACAAAKVQVGDAARFVGQQAIQLHGGMGVTEEMAVSHYFKRLTCIAALFGDIDHHLGVVSDVLLAA